MRELLKTNEVRRINLVEQLNAHVDWITLTELAKKLKVSESSLKEDISYFRKNYTMFRIDTSYQGVRIEFKPNSGLKIFYQWIIENSLAFNLIEEILYVEDLSENDIVEKFFISKSTLYRLLKEINAVLLRTFNISLSMNPFSFIGSERDIRYFYYTYFNERYSELDWPLPSIDKKSFDTLLQQLLELYGVKLHFSDYLNLRLVTTINLFRYKNKHLVKTSSTDQVFNEKLKLLPDQADIFKPLEEKLGIEINKESILQIFDNYLRDSYSVSYTNLIKKTKKDKELATSVEYLSVLIDDISEKFAIPVNNKKEIILKVTNAAYNEHSKPYNQYILYNRMSVSIKRFTNNFPNFSEYLSKRLKEYRKLVSVLPRHYSLNNLYIEFIYAWQGIIYELQHKWPKTNILIVSDISYGHADTIKDILRFVYEDSISIDIFEDYQFIEGEMKNKPYDIILANFPIKHFEEKRLIYIENIPTVKNLATIQKGINEVNIEKKTRDYYTY